jgi:hypothetical protein
MAQILETGLVVNGLTGNTNSLQVVNSSGNDSFIVSTNGNVGIGVTTPSTDFEINGKTKTETLQVVSGAVAGHVLTLTDTQGNSQWQLPTNINALVVSGSTPISAITNVNTLNISVQDAKADSVTKGVSTFNLSDFNDDGNGLISIDYVNGQSASGSTKGFLTSSDWSTFNNKQNKITLTTTGTSGVSTLVATTSTGDTLNIPQYGGGTGSGDGYSLTLGCGPTASMVSGTTYVFGSAFVFVAVTLASDRPSRRIRAFKDGRIVIANVVTQLSGNVFATPSSATTIIEVYNVTTSASSVIDSAFPITGGTSWDNTSSLPSRNVLYVLSSPLAVNTNDEIQIRMTGNWTGAPSSVSHTVILHIE